MNVKTIVTQYLNEHGYDGLYLDSSTGGCDCTINTLMHCEQPDNNCIAGYLVACDQPLALDLCIGERK